MLQCVLDSVSGLPVRRSAWPFLLFTLFCDIHKTLFVADPSDRAVQGPGLRRLAFWDCGFESRRGNGCLSCECFVFVRGLSAGLITCPEESY